jgi:hypothetical protein
VTVKIIYDISMDAQYLVMWNQDLQGHRHFIAGPNGIGVDKHTHAPVEVKHSITTFMLQELLDAILAEGIRPSSNACSAGHVSDLKAHIAFAEGMATALLPKVQNNG